MFSVGLTTIIMSFIVYTIIAIQLIMKVVDVVASKVNNILLSSLAAATIVIFSIPLFANIWLLVIWPVLENFTDFLVAPYRNM